MRKTGSGIHHRNEGVRKRRIWLIKYSSCGCLMAHVNTKGGVIYEDEGKGCYKTSHLQPSRVDMSIQPQVFEPDLSFRLVSFN